MRSIIRWQYTSHCNEPHPLNLCLFTSPLHQVRTMRMRDVRAIPLPGAGAEAVQKEFDSDIARLQAAIRALLFKSAPSAQ